MLKTINIVLILALATPTFLSADINKGKKIYLKKLKSKCKINGAQMAEKHTQYEWNELFKNGEFQNNLSELCPKGEKIIKSDKFKNRYQKHLYDFFHEYGSDSGNFPSC